MMKILCLAEKPSQAKEIAQKLSDGTARARSGGSDRIWNYDFTFSFNNQPSTFVMTSLAGHVQELDFNPAYKKWTSCPPSSLFTLPVFKTVPKDKVKMVQNLEREARGCQILILWTDCDREGENIGAEGAEIAKRANPRLQVYRAKFSVMLPRELKEACQSPGRIDQRLVDAVDTRQEVDLRIGASLTRFQTMTLQKEFSSLDGKVISYGSCQFPTLGFVVDRFLRIRDFIPEEFYKLLLSHTKDNISVPFHWNRGELFDQLICLVIYERCIENCTAKVTKVESKPTSKWRPLPLTTVELQKQGARLLKMSSDKIMEVANKLYLQGFISYPRTETDIFDKKFEILPLIQKQTSDPQYSQYSSKLLNEDGFQWPRQGKTNDMSHPPIHPTAAAPSLTGEDKKVYEFITRRFLAVCSKDARGHQTLVEVTVAEEVFTAKGLTVLELNYLDIYPYEKWSDKNLPVFHLGEEFVPTTLEMVDGMTQPPNLLSESELITIMSRNGIGTDATIHEHIKKVLDREYVYKQGVNNLFHPSELGVGLVEGYDRIGLDLSLSKPWLRKQFEDKLRGICEGTHNKEQVLLDTIHQYKVVFDKTYTGNQILIQALSAYIQPQANLEVRNIPTIMQPLPVTVMQCPLCLSEVPLKVSQNRWFLGCNNFPQCKFTLWFPSAKLSSVEVDNSNCSSCFSQNRVIKKLKFGFKDFNWISQYGQNYVGCIKCDEILTNLMDLWFSQSLTTHNPTTTNINTTTTVINNRQNGQNLQPFIPRTSAPQSSIPIESAPQANNMDMYRQMITNTDDTSVVRCNCGLVAVKLITRNGPNAGKEFYKCRTETGNCTFFQWLDQPNNVASSGGGNQPQGQCYRCQQSGHFANQCPQTTNINPTNNTNNPLPNVICFRCNQPGHFSTTCPNIQQDTRGSSRGSRGSRSRSTRSRGRFKSRGRSRGRS